MTTHFNSITEFLVYLGEHAIEPLVWQENALDRATALLQGAAKEKIGEYQPKAGPFREWDELAESTLDEKWRLGFTGQVSTDDPLLRTGAGRDSIERNFDAREGFVGTDLEYMAWQELGTEHMPPRSFLGGAAFEHALEVLHIVGISAVMSIAGEEMTGEWQREYNKRWKWIDSSSNP